MKIYKNNFVHNPCYFIELPSEAQTSGSPIVDGYQVEFYNNEWHCSFAHYYAFHLKDTLLVANDSADTFEDLIKQYVVDRVDTL